MEVLGRTHRRQEDTDYSNERVNSESDHLILQGTQYGSPLIDRDADRLRESLSYSLTPGSIESGGGEVSYSKIIKDDDVSHDSSAQMELPGITQIPAVLLVCFLNLMISIPFGVSYFPVGWKSLDSDSEGDTDDDGVNGAFPLPAKEALGIRMFLFSTFVGQIAFTFTSRFNGAIGMQMVENVPFCHSLCYIVISEMGYGLDALSNIFFLFGLSTLLVGISFYSLGKLDMGRIVYFFPSHVLIGCIGGIGVFIMKTGIEVSTNTTVTYDMNGILNLINKFHLIWPIIAFEFILRVMMRLTDKKYPLLGPIFFFCITPIFYLVLHMFHISMENMERNGYFFPEPNKCEVEGCVSSLFDDHLFDMWRFLDFRTVRWAIVWKALPTMISLIAFSLIHVPINIPALAISTGIEADMNAELIAHGYSNLLSGVSFGLQNYLCYANSILYYKSGGGGKFCSLSIAALTGCFFVVGPSVAAFMPRCMAGTLLLHIGIDLVIEGVFDSYFQFDAVEYAGVWLITIVMTLFGISSALVAGAVAALSTYTFQSITYQNPVRGSMSASTLRSSRWNRPADQKSILGSNTIGRNRIFVIQLQGHIFFGNVIPLSDNVKEILLKRKNTDGVPWVVILDFTLVLGIDSSAAQTIAKLKDAMLKKFKIPVAIFVTGSNEGFPTNFDLCNRLVSEDAKCSVQLNSMYKDQVIQSKNLISNEPNNFLHIPRRSKQYGDQSLENLLTPSNILATHICKSLDEALAYAEDVLICHQNPCSLGTISEYNYEKENGCTLDKNECVALQQLANLCPGEDICDVKELLKQFEKEKFKKDEIIWRQGSNSDSLKLLVSGKVLSLLENEAGTVQEINAGTIFGELALVTCTDRLSTVRCETAEALLYSLSNSNWEFLKKNNPKVARFVDLIVIRYLAHRVQHVSNRIFETRCLPV